MAGELVEKTASHFRSLSQEAGRFNEGTSQLVTAVESLVERVNSIQAPNDLLATKLGPCVEAISEASEEVRKRAKADKGIIEKLAAVIENVAVAADHAETKMHAAAEEGARAEELLAKLSTIAQKFDEAATRSKENAEESRSVSLAHETLKNKLNDSLSKVSESLSEGAQRIITRQDAALTQLEQAVADTVLSIKSHNVALASELAQSRQYTEDVHAALVSVAKSVTEQLAS
jgi:chromosome segregation ATPase